MNSVKYKNLLPVFLGLIALFVAANADARSMLVHKPVVTDTICGIISSFRKQSPYAATFYLTTASAKKVKVIYRNPRKIKTYLKVGSNLNSTYACIGGTKKFIKGQAYIYVNNPTRIIPMHKMDDCLPIPVKENTPAEQLYIEK